MSLLDVCPGIEFYGFPWVPTLALGAQSKNRNPALLPYLKQYILKVLPPIEFTLKHFFLYVRTINFPPMQFEF